MGKQIYRRAMNDIVPSQALLNRTSVRMRNIRNIKTKRLLNVVKIGLYGSALLGAFLLLVSLTNEPFKPIDHSAVNESPIETILPTNKYGEIGVTLDASKVRDHIQSYFTPFQASEYTPVRAPYPYFPLEYENLKLESAAIVQVTIQEKDVYREKEAVYYPRASFGTYIYVAKVESVWHGDIDTDQLIPISELAWAIPGEQAEEIEWSFKPYTARSLGELELGEQYVLFLVLCQEIGQVKCGNSQFTALTY